MPCDVNDLLASPFSGHDIPTLKIAQLELLRRASGTTLTPSELMASNPTLGGLSPHQQTTLQLEILCRILG